MPPRTRTPAPEPAPEAPDSGGYFRNASGGALTVLGTPTRTLEPGRIARFERTPTHRDLAPASEADYQAQLGADEDVAKAAAPVPATDSTEA